MVLQKFDLRKGTEWEDYMGTNKNDVTKIDAAKLLGNISKVLCRRANA